MLKEVGTVKLRQTLNKYTQTHTYLFFKVVVIEELLVHCVCVGVDGSEEYSSGQCTNEVEL